MFSFLWRLEGMFTDKMMKEKLEKRQVLSDKPCSVVHILMCMGKAIVTVKLKKKKS